MFQVAIVGRPNVGKSTLFNRLCGSMKAIVGDEPGITRDRIYGSVRWNEKLISVLDTGGMIPETREIIPERILKQVAAAVSESQLILLIVDGRAGITPLDEQLLPMMRKTGKPVWTVVNKIDSPALESYTAPFYEFGTEQIYPVSAEHGHGAAELLDALAARADVPLSDVETEPVRGNRGCSSRPAQRRKIFAGEPIARFRACDRDGCPGHHARCGGYSSGARRNSISHYRHGRDSKKGKNGRENRESQCGDGAEKPGRRRCRSPAA